MPDLQGYVNTGLENVNASSASPYGTITCTLGSLANNAQRSSASVNSTNYHPSNSLAGQYMAPLDFGLIVKIKTGGTISGTPIVNVYLVGSNDGGNTWSDGVSGLGTDSLVTLTYPYNVIPLGSINTPAASTIYKGGPWSVGLAFGGVPASAWAIVIENKTGGSLDSSGGIISYQMSVGTFF